MPAKMTLALEKENHLKIVKENRQKGLFSIQVGGATCVLLKANTS